MKKHDVPQPERLPGGELVSRKIAAQRLGVTVRTLDRYIEQGKLNPYRNRVNGRLYIDSDQILYLLGSRVPQDRLVIAYCRTAPIPDSGAAGVSSATRLKEQVDRVEGYCTARGIRVDEVIKEVRRANRLDDNAPGLNRIMDLVVRKKVSTLILETPDRLARFLAWDLLERVLLYHGVEIHIIQPKVNRQEFVDEIKEELVDIIARAKELGV
jgi:predicted site-specific integrase-resolvase